MESHFITVSDETRLHFVDSELQSNKAPLLCLAGITRNCRDFEPVFDLLKNERRVIALDFRGRGKSQNANPATYTAKKELEDTLQLLDHLKLSEVCVLGTSRGGIVGMLMAAFASNRICGLLLNDIGPALEPAAIGRIRDLIGKSVVYENWDDAARATAARAVGFENVSDEQWKVAVRRMLQEQDGRPHSFHDPRLADTFPNPDEPMPDLWPVFDTIGKMPLGVIRGYGSDLLTEATVGEMKRRKPDLLITRVAGRGHVPFLDEPEAVSAIREFLLDVDMKKGA